MFNSIPKNANKTNGYGKIINLLRSQKDPDYFALFCVPKTYFVS